MLKQIDETSAVAHELFCCIRCPYIAWLMENITSRMNELTELQVATASNLRPPQSSESHTNILINFYSLAFAISTLTTDMPIIDREQLYPQMMERNAEAQFGHTKNS